MGLLLWEGQHWLFIVIVGYCFGIYCKKNQTAKLLNLGFLVFLKNARFGGVQVAFAFGPNKKFAVSYRDVRPFLMGGIFAGTNIKCVSVFVETGLMGPKTRTITDSKSVLS